MGGGLMDLSVMKRASALLPIGMSLAALALVLGFVATYGVVESEDEGGAARLYQLLMVAQVPIAAYFAVKWVPRAPRQALMVLALQAAAALVAIAVLLFFES